jgi:hypothetical protein
LLATNMYLPALVQGPPANPKRPCQQGVPALELRVVPGVAELSWARGQLMRNSARLPACRCDRHHAALGCRPAVHDPLRRSRLLRLPLQQLGQARGFARHAAATELVAESVTPDQCVGQSPRFAWLRLWRGNASEAAWSSVSTAASARPRHRQRHRTGPSGWPSIHRRSPGR